MSPVTIKIKNIEQGYLKDEKYKYICENLGKPLLVRCVRWNADGGVNHIVIDTDTSVEPILLFRENKIEGELSNGIELRFS